MFKKMYFILVVLVPYITHPMAGSSHYFLNKETITQDDLQIASPDTIIEIIIAHPDRFGADAYSQALTTSIDWLKSEIPEQNPFDSGNAYERSLYADDREITEKKRQGNIKDLLILLNKKKELAGTNVQDVKPINEDIKKYQAMQPMGWKIPLAAGVSILVTAAIGTGIYLYHKFFRKKDNSVKRQPTSNTYVQRNK